MTSSAVSTYLAVEPSRHTLASSDFVDFVMALALSLHARLKSRASLVLVTSSPYPYPVFDLSHLERPPATQTSLSAGQLAPPKVWMISLTRPRSTTAFRLSDKFIISSPPAALRPLYPVLRSTRTWRFLNDYHR